MYLDKSQVKTAPGKTHTRYLLRESFRENGKVKKRTIANISHCSEGEIQALRLALKHKSDLSSLGSAKDSVSLEQGPPVGAVWLLSQVAKQLGISKALGNSQSAKLALWQIIARLMDQGSRLSAVRLADAHNACGMLGLDAFDEDDLYENLDYLNQQQEEIEDRLFQATRLCGAEATTLFLYDVTSSYLEGQCNELAAYGYNRDKKAGKKQIVVGLLCDIQGRPVSIEVFEGNTRDPQTVESQIKKITERFGINRVCFVGDRGMIQSAEMEALKEVGFSYITAITKPQIEKLIKQGAFQLELFESDLIEIEEGGIRYIFRRNPERAREIQQSREEKYLSLDKLLKAQNQYLQEHPRAKLETAFNKVTAKAKQLRISDWVEIQSQERSLQISKDPLAVKQKERLDGCYVLKSDLKAEEASKETIHSRYKDLSQVEWAFRSMKTVQLEMRPLYVRLASRTRGHALVVMLAYRIIQELSQRWASLNLRVAEGIEELKTLCAIKVRLKDGGEFHQIPKPNKIQDKLLKLAQVSLPKALPAQGPKVSTRRKLMERRKNL